MFNKESAKVYMHKDDRMVVEHPNVITLFAGSSMGLTPCVVDYAMADDLYFSVVGLRRLSMSAKTMNI
jgi:hypothetical protein